MLHNEDTYILTHRTDGEIGLELESQRIDRGGNLSRTKHPFPNDVHIDRDFGEAQLEINTSPADHPQAALCALHHLLSQVHEKLRERGELLWPFSNPPAINSEQDIEIASFTGSKAASYEYRKYLTRRYGKYQMTYSGIHFNYSFSEALLRRNFQLDAEAGSFREYKDQFYLELAEKVLAYSWVVVALLSASPLADSSFFELGQPGRTVFTGCASLRSSHLGYWNHFSPVLSYRSIQSYTDSIQQYIDCGMLSQVRELYYPVRIKSPGVYSLEGLVSQGVNHIELRMIDLNPFFEDGICYNDITFLQLFLVWLASLPRLGLDANGQMIAMQNHKTAAAYDWDISRIIGPDGSSLPLRQALGHVLDEMDRFYAADTEELRTSLLYQRGKLRDEANRYASRVRARFGEDYLKSGLAQAAQTQAHFG